MQSKGFLVNKEVQINSRFERPQVPQINPKEEDFEFFCIDIDHYVDKPPKYMDMVENSRDLSIIRLYGVTSESNSVTIHVHNFKPYFFIQIPNSMEIDEKEMEDLRKYFNNKLVSPGIEKCEWVLKKSIMHYTDKLTRFVKVTATLTKHISQLRQMIEKGLSWSND